MCKKTAGFFFTLLLSGFTYAKGSTEQGQYQCFNGVTKQQILGGFDRDEALLIQLAGGYCNAKDSTTKNPVLQPIYECRNTATNKKVQGQYNTYETKLIELGGGKCHAIEQNVSKRSEGNTQALKDVGLSDEAVNDAIREARKRFNLQKYAFIEAQDVDSGFKTIKFSLIFRNWENRIAKVRVNMHYWSENIKGMELEYAE